MARYADLEAYLPMDSADPDDERKWKKIVGYLTDIWLDEYASANSDIVETRTAEFSYLFDIAAGRLIGAWGISRGRHGEARDKARMSGHPLSAGPGYHRGHAVPHTLGGPCDINLVPQLARVNVGSFRALEREAVSTPGSFYFTHWIYPDDAANAEAPTQVPCSVEQGLLIPGLAPRIVLHAN